ncbi:hypothetical protein BH10PSE7_BH10PSE7_31580 [soil metagenome]
MLKVALSDLPHRDIAAHLPEIEAARKPRILVLQLRPPSATPEITDVPAATSVAAAAPSPPIMSWLKKLARGLSSALSSYASDSAAARVMPFTLIMRERTYRQHRKFD